MRRSRHAHLAAAIPEVCRATVSTLRQRLWKVGAWVEVGATRICFHVSAHWPWRTVWERVQGAVAAFVTGLGAGPAPATPGVAGVVM